MNAESELEMVHRHVLEGERHLALQHDIVAHLREIGGSTQIAEDLLVVFQNTLAAHRDHLDRLNAEVRSE